MTQPATYALRLPQSLKAAVAEVSKRDGTSINNFITVAIAEKYLPWKLSAFLRKDEVVPIWMRFIVF